MKVLFIRPELKFADIVKRRKASSKSQDQEKKGVKIKSPAANQIQVNMRSPK